MRWTTLLLSVAWVPAASGCMAMHGAGGSGAMRDSGDPSHGPGDHSAMALRQAEARSGDRSLALSFPAPALAVEVPIEVRVYTGGEAHAPFEAAVWLRVRGPDGRVDDVRVPRLEGASEGAALGPGHGHGVTPVAVVGGVSMLVIMALMMAGHRF